MFLPGLAQIVLSLLWLSPIQQTPEQKTPAIPESRQIPISQNQLCCIDMHFVKPVYPQKARLAHIEGEVKLHLSVAENGTITELQVISGDPLLVEATVTAVHQWRFGQILGRVVGPNLKPIEYEIPITFTFIIEEPRKPIFLHLANGDVIHVDTVREFTDRLEYTVGGEAHSIAPDSLILTNTCPWHIPPTEADIRAFDCVPGGGPGFDIRAIPLLRSDKEKKTTDKPSQK